ncbi:MAG TPA: OmpA family protein, partial [Geobacteraceae bacterium]|nr:OmpA family protein [Geobacteraceae bacterium]
MIKSFSKYALLLIIGAFIVSGCAKHEMVKKDEVVPPATNAKPAEMPTGKSALQEVGIKEQPVKEARLKEQAMKESRADAQMGASLERIFFDFDSSLLTPAARGTLAKNAEMIKKKAGMKIQIEGHCDERGSDEYNVALGEKRARSAMQYLVTMG